MSRDLAELVAPVLAADGRVRFAYVFGSVATGTAGPRSDVDLAVSVSPRGTLLDDARLHDALIRALGRADVDLLVLEDAPVWMRRRAVAGRPVYSRDDVARVRHRAAVEMEFLDFEPFYEEYLAAVHDRPRLDQLLSLLARYVTILRELATVPLPDFVADPRNYGSAERFLQLAIETVLGIGNHVIADAGFGQPSTYAEIITVLGAEQVLGAELAADLQPMARMRNRLVHHYQDVSAELLHEILVTRLGDFDRFAEQIVAYADGA